MRIQSGLTRLGRGGALVLACAAALMLSACGSSEDSSGTTTSSSTAEAVAASTANVEAAYDATGDGFDIAGPAAQKGKKVLYISAGAATPDGTLGVNASKAYAKSLGWDLSVFDGKFSAQVYQEGIRQAISQNADGIFMYGIDCPQTKKPLEEARAAGVKIVALGQDCNENDPGAEPLFDATVTHPGGVSEYEFYEQLGRIQADWIIAKTDGKAKVIQFAVPEFAVTAATDKGFKDQLAKCPECQILNKVDVLIDDFGPQLQEKAAQALLKSPEANADRKSVV